VTISLPLPITALVTDRSVSGDVNSMIHAVDAAVAGGVGLVQLRERDLSVHDLLEVAQHLRAITRGRALLFVSVDDVAHLEVAVSSEADGVQLAEGPVSVKEARRLLRGKPLLVGRSVHSIRGALEAAASGADLLVLGSVFPSLTHPDRPAIGTGLVGTVSAQVQIPVVGIGGITAANTAPVIGAGASGVAVIREVLAAPDPLQAAQRLHQAAAEAYASQKTQPGQSVQA
jgi:thiamine-phosphate diphosphorylase